MSRQDGGHDAKITQIYEGTNEIQRMVISTTLQRGLVLGVVWQGDPL